MGDRSLPGDKVRIYPAGTRRFGRDPKGLLVRVPSQERFFAEPTVANPNSNDVVANLLDNDNLGRAVPAHPVNLP